MRVRLYPKKDGTSTVYLERNRPKEGRNVLVEGIKQGSLSAVVSREVRKMRGESADESQTGSREST